MPRSARALKRAVSVFLFLGILVATAAPASACMAVPMPEAVLFDRPPAKRPPGYLLLEVTGTRVDGDPEHILVRLTNPAQGKRHGTKAWLRAHDASSCTEWGRLGSKAFAVVRPSGTLAGLPVLVARVYRRSRWDYIWNWFGVTRYGASGDALDNRSRWR